MLAFYATMPRELCFTCPSRVEEAGKVPENFTASDCARGASGAAEIAETCTEDVGKVCLTDEAWPQAGWNGDGT